MLTRSLCCFRGISAAAERKLWRAGCLTWRDLPVVGARALSAKKADDLVKQVRAMQAAHAGQVADYFLNRLPPGYRVRVLADYWCDVWFLDVETTGLGTRDEVTVIGLQQAGQPGRSFVRGQNLEDFLEHWGKIRLLVTFNGARFDLPFLSRCFGLRVMPPHVDLLIESKEHGYVGGLKRIEHALGIKRGAEEVGDGAMAVTLWDRYAKMDDGDSLQLLLRYNTRDVASLEAIVRALWRRTFDTYPGPLPTFPFH